MNRRQLAAIGLGLLGYALPSGGTEEHVLTVYQALATSPEIAIQPVSYLTRFGAEEETTLQALSWPSALTNPEGDQAVPTDLNWASILGVTFVLEYRDMGWRLDMDLTQMKAIPPFAKERLAMDWGRAEVLERLLNAAERNLQSVGLFDCPVNVIGEKAHHDLKAFKPPLVLNPIADAWGPWTFKALRRTYPDGDLHALAAKSLLDEDALHTIFLILCGETHTEEAEKEKAQLVGQLLGRLGDARFAAVLKEAETQVQEEILATLKGAPAPGRGEDGGSLRVWFPRTFGIEIKR